MLAAVTATGRFMFPNVLFEPPSTFKAGLPDEIQVGQVDERFKQRVWRVAGADPDIQTGAIGIFALSTVCTHLGCTPNWLEAEQKFKCPCHGSGYYKNGINFEGPTPRPLERFAISLGDDGQILVDKSRKFQYEKGEWTNPAVVLKTVMPNNILEKHMANLIDRLKRRSAGSVARQDRAVHSGKPDSTARFSGSVFRTPTANACSSCSAACFFTCIR